MFIVEVPYVNLNKMSETPQAFDWFKLWEDKYIVCDGSNCVLVEQNNDKLAFHCSEEEFFNEWYNYFAMQNDYFEITERIKDFDDRTVSTITEFAKGIRILNRDPHDVTLWHLINERLKADDFSSGAYWNVCLFMGSGKKLSVPGIGKQFQPLAPSADVILKYQDRLNMKAINDDTRKAIIDYATWWKEGHNWYELFDESEKPWWCTPSLIRSLKLYCNGDLNTMNANDVKSYIALYLQADKETWQDFYVQNLDPYAGVFCEWLRYYGRRKARGIVRQY